MCIQLGPEHGEPASVVQAAVDHQKRAEFSAADHYTRYDQVWCVLDVEAPKPHDRLDDALLLASRNGVKVALSNPCFELWLLLHFGSHTAYLTTKQAQTRLEGLKACGYTAERKHLDYVRVEPLYKEARQRAIRLRHTAGGAQAKTTNPWTDLDVFIDVLHAARRGV